jgi:hypothetical protein
LLGSYRVLFVDLFGIQEGITDMTPGSSPKIFRAFLFVAQRTSPVREYSNTKTHDNPAFSRAWQAFGNVHLESIEREVEYEPVTN